jgi:hypothetical protein
MAYIDNSLIVSGSVTIAGSIAYQTPTLTANAVTLSTNVIDLGLARDIGEGGDLFMRVLVGTGFSATAACTVDFQVISAQDAALTTNVTVIGAAGPTPVSNTVSVAAAALVAGMTYKVVAIGTTDFSLIGGTNTVGSIFTATGAGTGTGTSQLSGLTAGTRMAVALSPSISNRGQRYLGVRFLLAGTLLTGSAFIDLGVDIQDGQKFYPGGFAIL